MTVIQAKIHAISGNTSIDDDFNTALYENIVEDSKLYKNLKKNLFNYFITNNNLDIV